MKVNISLGAFPGRGFKEAAGYAISGKVIEPLFGNLDYSHLQLCPQNFGCLSEEVVDELLGQFGDKTQFRLHANVRVLDKHALANISGFDLYPEYFVQASKISKKLSAPAYTAHAGLRSEATMEQLFENTKRLADVFDCPVGIEGHFPNRHNNYLVSTWDEYRQLLDSGLPYALDLSHLNIVANQSGCYEINLVSEMLSSTQCLEVHLSANDGKGDTHQKLIEPPWWYGLLMHAHEKAIFFSEGNQLHNVKPRMQ